MNRKTIIQLVIIIAAFGGAGVVLYNGFFSSPEPDVSVSTTQSGAVSQSPGAILPYGSSLNLEIFHSKALANFQFTPSTYPKLNPQGDVGKTPISSLITTP